MKKVVASILLILGLVFIINGINDAKYLIDNKVKNQSIREIATSNTSDPLERVIDFEKLKVINEDIEAWIYVPGTNIDYPILVGSSDEEYIYKNLNREYTPLGSIFTYSGTNFTKGNTFIFGHNMANGQMFGELKRYIDMDFLKENRYFYIYTERKVMKCNIFSVFIVNENDDVFSNEYELGTADYLSLLSRIINKSNYSDSILDKPTIEYSTAQMFNLVTCYGKAGTSNRLLVNGLVVDEKIR